MKVHAQQHFTKSTGLLSNTVYNSFRDSKGYIWFGTDKGACRFNGKDFKTYTVLNGLPDNSVLDFFEDIQGRLWLFCYNGGGCYIYNGKVHNAGNDKLLAKMPTIPFQRAMCSAPDSSLYIAYKKTPILKVKDTTVSIIFNRPPAVAVQQTVICALQYQKDTLYAYDQISECIKLHHDKYAGADPMRFSMTTINGNTKYTTRNDTIFINKSNKLVAVYSNKKIENSKIVKIVPHDESSLFCCLHDGLLLINYINNTETWLLKDLKVSSICKSISGDYWVTTLTKGVYELNPDLYNTEPLIKINDDEVFQRNDNLYRTTGDSIYTFDHISLKQHAVKTEYNSFWKILGDDDHYLIYSSSRSNAFVNKKTGVTYNDVLPQSINAIRPASSFCIPIHNDEYFLVSENWCTYISIKNNHAHNIYNFFDQGKTLRAKRSITNGRFYILTNSKLIELNIPDSSAKTIDSFTNFIPAELFCFDNNIFVTSNTDNLIIYTHGTRRKRSYKLAEVNISNILQISKNKFILATNKGYSLLILPHSHTDSIYIQPIFYPYNSSGITDVYTCGDNLLMNVNNGIYKVDPAFINARTTKPVFFIDSVLVNNKSDTSQYIVINSSSNISVMLGTLYFGNPDISYQYRIVKDKDKGQWFHSDGSIINLSLPSYGNYTIEFAAVADNNNTSASQFLYVSWPPPFYLTWWFFSILGLLFIALVIYMLYLYNQRKKLKFEREMDQLQLEHKAINSLLNPHFVFNAINNIQNLVNKYRVDNANEYLARLSRLIRQNIENLQFNLITAEKELSLIRNYIYLQNLRFADKIRLQINNTADADKLYLPPLLIHTFVENSVVHGFSPDIKDFTITIDIHPDGKDYVDIIITDNGLGLNKPTQAQQALKDKTSIGVDATRRRLQKLSEFYKVDYKLDITDRQATDGVPGAKVSIRFYAHLGSLLPVS